MALTYVGNGQIFRRLPAEDLTDAVLEAAAARSSQGVDDLTRDLLASGLYVSVPESVAEPVTEEAPVKPRKSQIPGRKAKG